MIIFSSFRALGLMLLGLFLWGTLAKISPHTAWSGIVLFLVGLGVLAAGRHLARPRRVDTVAGARLYRERHSLFFVPVWVWGVVAMVVAVPLAIHPV